MKDVYIEWKEICRCIERICDCVEDADFDGIKSMFIDAKPADVRPVVRCKDCKYAHMTYSGDAKYCDKIKEMTDDGDGGYGGSLYLPGDWFCAYGERRKSDGN